MKKKNSIDEYKIKKKMKMEGIKSVKIKLDFSEYYTEETIEKLAYVLSQTLEISGIQITPKYGEKVESNKRRHGRRFG